jgi:hypothetical protein
MPLGVKQKKENSLSQAHNFRRGSFSILNSQFLILMTINMIILINQYT